MIISRWHERRPKAAPTLATLVAAVALLAFAGPLASAGAAPLQKETAAAREKATAPAGFDRLLEEADVELAIPADWREMPPPANDLFDFDRAWTSPDGRCEIRIAVRPIARMVIDYEDPHSAAPDPNDIHPLVFTAMIGQFARQGEMPARDLPRSMARKAFNADWAALAAFGADPALNTRHSEALLLALHKSHTADVYILFLYDDPARAREMLKQVLKVARFRTATPLAALKREAEAARRARESWMREMKDAGADKQCIPPLDARPIKKTAKDMDQTPQR